MKDKKKPFPGGLERKLRFTAALIAAALLPQIIISGSPENCFAGADAGQPGSFLLQSPDARGLSLGFSYCALADNAAASYYNPAGLSGLSKPELNLSRTWLFEDTDYTFLAFGYPAGKNAGLGAAYIGQVSSGFEKRTTPLDTPQNFSISNRALLLGGGVRLPAGFPLFAGLVLKDIIYSVDDRSDSSLGADAGFSAEPAKGWTVASVFHNLVKPGIKLVSKKTSYYGGFTLATAYTRELSDKLSASMSLGTRKYERADPEFSAGLEFSYLQAAALRLSVDETGFSSGVGARSGNYLLDYAVNFHELEQVHTISLSVKFGITMQELENYIKKGITRFDRKEALKLAEAYAQKAELFLKDRNYPQAIKAFETSLLWDPQNGGIADKLKLANEEMDSSLNREVIEKNSLIARRYYGKEDFISSREYWLNVLKLDGANAEAKDFLDKIANRLNLMEKQKLEQEKTEVLNKQVSAYLAEGTNLLKKEIYSLALAKAKKALALEPGNASAKALASIAAQGFSLSIQKRLAEINGLCSVKMYPKAMALIDSLLEEAPEQKKEIEKITACKEVTVPEISPEDGKKIERLYYLAVDAYLKDNYKEAAKNLEEIFKINPLDATARTLSEKIKSAERISK